MIPENFIEGWRKTVPWQMDEQIEQDLIISRALVDLYPQEQLGLVLDTGHAAIHGDDVAKEIYIAGNRLGGVHLQDPNKELDYDEHSLPTRGGLDWDVIRIALADIKYAGAWTFEIHKTLEGETPEELASQCRKLATSWGCG